MCDFVQNRPVDDRKLLPTNISMNGWSFRECERRN
jgi:hypothetical protein